MWVRKHPNGRHTYLHSIQSIDHGSITQGCTEGREGRVEGKEREDVRERCWTRQPLYMLFQAEPKIMLRAGWLSSRGWQIVNQNRNLSRTTVLCFIPTAFFPCVFSRIRFSNGRQSAHVCAYIHMYCPTLLGPSVRSKWLIETSHSPSLSLGLVTYRASLKSYILHLHHCPLHTSHTLD
jgi:hypothetical protein